MNLEKTDGVSLGQLFMVGLPGKELDASTLHLIAELRINNFVIFSRNVRDKEQLSNLCRQLREACHANNLPMPLISIDQEGGSVARLPPPFAQFKDARILAQANDAEHRLAEYAKTCSRELLEVGINMNLAPVLDVCAAGKDFFMERRSLGDDPLRVAQLGVHIITIMQQCGVAACAKHFPGLGAAVVDPHVILPRVDRSAEELRSIDLIPFRQAAAAGVAAIMTSHTIYSSLDQEVPATVSRKILSDLLRQEMGFDGLVITDDLEMGAIEREQPLESAAVKALSAGADLLLICHDHTKVVNAFNAVDEARKRGELSLKGLTASMSRVAAVRSSFVTGH